MKRMILATALLLLGSGLAAQADTSQYTNLLKQPRDDDALAADARYCEDRVGPDRNGVPTSPAYKRCMRTRGWRFDYTKAQKTWIDPDTGDTCHEILGGLGSSCGNIW
jgi:hypothetical protein